MKEEIKILMLQFVYWAEEVEIQNLLWTKPRLDDDDHQYALAKLDQTRNELCSKINEMYYNSQQH